MRNIENQSHVQRVMNASIPLFTKPARMIYCDSVYFNIKYSMPKDMSVVFAHSVNCVLQAKRQFYVCIYTHAILQSLSLSLSLFFVCVCVLLSLLSVQRI